MYFFLLLPADDIRLAITLSFSGPGSPSPKLQGGQLKTIKGRKISKVKTPSKSKGLIFMFRHQYLLDN